MIGRAVRLLRGTGADLPFGDPGGAHVGVALESHFWRFADHRRRCAALCAITRCRDAHGEAWTSVVLGFQGPRGRVVEAAEVRGVAAAEDGLRLVGGGVDATATRVRAAAGDAGIDVEVDGPRGWPRRRHGGLGLAHVVPGLSQYWHPHLLGGRARGTFRVGRAEHVLDGALAYGEKNWGAGGAPPAWWWGQGGLDDGEVAFAFAGGVLEAGPARAGATAAVVLAGDELAAFSPPLAVVRTRAGGGEWRVEAVSAGHRLRLHGAAPGRPLDLPVPVPGQQRTTRASHQHQDGVVELELRRGRRLVTAGTATLCGLELGGPG